MKRNPNLISTSFIFIHITIDSPYQVVVTLANIQASPFLCGASLRMVINQWPFCADRRDLKGLLFTINTLLRPKPWDAFQPSKLHSLRRQQAEAGLRRAQHIRV